MAYAVAITTGLRLSELRRLDQGDLDIENSRLRLRWRQTKNKKPAYCYLPASLTSVLAAFADSGAPRCLYEKAQTQRAWPESPLLFVPTHLLRLFNADMEKAQIAKETHEGRLDFHALRATGITLAVDLGASPKETQTFARHADPRLTFGTYVKQADTRMMALAERIGGVLPLVDCATGVHSTTGVGEPGVRKSLPEQALSFAQNAEGLCPSDTGPVSFKSRCCP